MTAVLQPQLTGRRRRTRDMGQPNAPFVPGFTAEPRAISPIRAQSLRPPYRRGQVVEMEPALADVAPNGSWAGVPLMAPVPRVRPRRHLPCVACPWAACELASGLAADGPKHRRWNSEA